MKSSGRPHLTEGHARKLCSLNWNAQVQLGVSRLSSEMDGCQPGLCHTRTASRWVVLSSPCTCHLAHATSLAPWVFRNAPLSLYQRMLRRWLGLGCGRGSVTGSYSFASRGGAVRIPDLPSTVWKNTDRCCPAATWEARHRAEQACASARTQETREPPQRLCPVVLWRMLPPSHPGSHSPRSMRPLFLYF